MEFSENYNNLSLAELDGEILENEDEEDEE